MDAELSGVGGAAELCELSRSGASGGSGGAAKGEMELGPSQGESLVGAGEVEESAHPSRKSAMMSQSESRALGLDKAVLHSIDCCGETAHRAARH